MFRKIRRVKNEISVEEAKRLLHLGSNGASKSNACGPGSYHMPVKCEEAIMKNKQLGRFLRISNQRLKPRK